MPTLQQIKDTVDSWIIQYWPTVQSQQTAYAAAHGGRYWQGLATHGTIPVDGIPVPADQLNNHPTDQPGNWNDFFGPLPATWPCMLIMDVYNGPQGQGYVGTLYIYDSASASTHIRSQNTGPETWRTQPWHEYVPVTP